VNEELNSTCYQLVLVVRCIQAVGLILTLC